MSAPLLDRLRARIDELDRRPVADHPQVLGEVHDALVAELDRLGAHGRDRDRD